MDFYSTIIRFFQDGGTFMYPIAVVLVCGLAIAIERWIFLSAAKFSNRRAFNQIMPLLKKRDLQGVLKQANTSKAPMGRIIGAGIARMAQSQRRDDIEYAMEEGAVSYTHLTLPTKPSG